MVAQWPDCYGVTWISSEGILTPAPACGMHSSTHREHRVLQLHSLKWGFPGGSGGKESACNVGDLGLIPGSDRSPGEGTDNPLQYSCLENPMDGGAW